MSISAIDKVIKTSNLAGSKFTALIMIADYAEDDGTNAHPTYPSLAAKARLKTKRSAMRIIDEMIEAGELVKHTGQGTRIVHGSDGNAYDIVFQDGSNWAEVMKRCKQFKTTPPPMPVSHYDLKAARAAIRGDEMDTPQAGRGDEMDTLEGDEMDTLEGDEMDTQSPSVESVSKNPLVSDRNQNGQVNDPTGLFTQDDRDRAVASEERREGYTVDPASVFHSQASENERNSQNPMDNPAYLALSNFLPAQEVARLIPGIDWCQQVGFEGDHAWLASAFIIVTDMTFLGLDDEGKRGRDIRKGWRTEFDLVLRNYPLADCSVFYYHAITEMKAAGLSIKGPRSIEVYLNQVISEVNERGHYESKQRKSV